MQEIVVRKWGNSLAMRIPKRMALQENIHEGDRFTVDATGDALVLRRVFVPKRYLVEDILDRFQTPGLSGEMDWEESEGDKS